MLRKGEQRALIAIVAFLTLSLCIRVLIENSVISPNAVTDAEFIYAMQTLRKELEEEGSDADEKKVSNKIRIESGMAHKARKALSPFPFDPNTIPADSLKEMHLPGIVSNNLIKYREAGGKYRNPSDLLKIYGMDSTIFNQILPFIHISEKEELYGKKRTADDGYNIPKIEINTTDSVKLQFIPGIGPVYSKRIIKYRELLGGYYNKDQFWEIYGMDSIRFRALVSYVHIDTSKLKRININTASFRDLLSHPYIDRASTYALIHYRDFADTISYIQEISDNQIIDDELFKKIRPYISPH